MMKSIELTEDWQKEVVEALGKPESIIFRLHMWEKKVNNFDLWLILNELIKWMSG